MSKTYTTKIYGASDDLVYACDDEISSFDEPTFLRFSDGTYVKVHYNDEGCWKVQILSDGKATAKKLAGLSEDLGDEHAQYHGDSDAPCYSDVVILTWSQPIDIVQRGHSPLKDPPKGLKTAQAIIDALNDRGGFDGWWSDVDDDSRNEILEEIAKLVEAAK